MSRWALNPVANVRMREKKGRRQRLREAHVEDGGRERRQEPQRRGAKDCQQPAEAKGGGEWIPQGPQEKPTLPAPRPQSRACTTLREYISVIVSAYLVVMFVTAASRS